MCLSAGKNETAKLKGEIIENGGTIKVYKVYRIQHAENVLTSPIFGECTGSQISKPGVITSSRPTTKVSWRKDYYTPKLFGATISRGIHVFLNRNGAKNYCSNGCVIVRLEVNAKDLVAAGTTGEKNVAVFRKVTLSQTEWDKTFTSSITVKRTKKK